MKLKFTPSFSQQLSSDEGFIHIAPQPTVKKELEAVNFFETLMILSHCK
jgi:hypothetical protein